MRKFDAFLFQYHGGAQTVGTGPTKLLKNGPFVGSVPNGPCPFPSLCHGGAERLEGRRHEAEQARTAGRGRRRRDGCEALEGCIQPQADRAVSGERMTRLTPDGRAVAGGAPP